MLFLYCACASWRNCIRTSLFSSFFSSGAPIVLASFTRGSRTFFISRTRTRSYAHTLNTTHFLFPKQHGHAAEPLNFRKPATAGYRDSRVLFLSAVDSVHECGRTFTQSFFLCPVGAGAVGGSVGRLAAHSASGANLERIRSTREAREARLPPRPPPVPVHREKCRVCTGSGLSAKAYMRFMVS